MTATDPEDQARRIAARASERDPTGWFEELYVAARSGDAAVPWDRGRPHPLLEEWTRERSLAGHGRTAVVVGCGLGSDAEHLSALGFDTTAFDVSSTAVATARERHPGSRVRYTTGDLLDLPAEWLAAYDFVLESLTVQSLPVALHERAIAGVRSLVAPGGTLLAISGVGSDSGQTDGPPWRLTRSEVETFAEGEVRSWSLEELVDEHDRALRRWRVHVVRSG